MPVVSVNLVLDDATMELIKQRIAQEENIADKLSIMISLATDNAKELLLGNIKSTAETGNLFIALYSLGVPTKDILKISVVERYGGNTISNAFINGFGIKNGAIASSVSHDSHNIIVVGTNSEYMAEATNKIIKNKGGLVAISNQEELEFPKLIKPSVYSFTLPIKMYLWNNRKHQYIKYRTQYKRLHQTRRSTKSLLFAG